MAEGNCANAIVKIGQTRLIFIWTAVDNKELGPVLNSQPLRLARATILNVDINDVQKWNQEEFLHFYRFHEILRRDNLAVYFLPLNSFSLFSALLSILTRTKIISPVEQNLIFRFNRLCQERTFVFTVTKIHSDIFCQRLETAIELVIDYKLAGFLNSLKGEFDELRDKIKATAITFTETATESSATLGIESAAQAIGQVAAGVFVSVLVDVALTSHCVYKAKRAKDQGIINARQFETKIKKKVCESGFQFIGSTTGSVVGQILIPVPVFGAFVGGLCGSLIGTGIGKGVNYGLFGKEELDELNKTSEDSFGLIVKIFTEVRERNPSVIIVYKETSKSFTEIGVEDIARQHQGLLQCEKRRLASPVTMLFGHRQIKKGKNVTLDMEKSTKKLKRRYSDCTQNLRYRVFKSDRETKLTHQNSQSTSSIDKCTQEEVSTEELVKEIEHSPQSIINDDENASSKDQRSKLKSSASTKSNEAWSRFQSLFKFPNKTKGKNLDEKSTESQINETKTASFNNTENLDSLANDNSTIRMNSTREMNSETNDKGIFETADGDKSKTPEEASSTGATNSNEDKGVFDSNISEKFVRAWKRKFKFMTSGASKNEANMGEEDRERSYKLWEKTGRDSVNENDDFSLNDAKKQEKITNETANTNSIKFIVEGIKIIARRKDPCGQDNQFEECDANQLTRKNDDDVDMKDRKQSAFEKYVVNSKEKKDSFLNSHLEYGKRVSEILDGTDAIERPNEVIGNEFQEEIIKKESPIERLELVLNEHESEDEKEETEKVQKEKREKTTAYFNWSKLKAMIKSNVSPNRSFMNV